MTKKDKRTLIIVIIAFFTITVSVLCGYFIEKTILTNSARDYLSQKYNMDRNAFELIDYGRQRYYLNSNAIPELEKGYYRWEFKCNERDFFVNMTDGKFRDDYQLEDIEKWCVDYLKENVDDSIVFVGVSSYDIYSYQRINGDNNDTVSYENIESFIQTGDGLEWDESDFYILIYYCNPNLSEEDMRKKLRKVSSSCSMESVNRLKYELKYYKDEDAWSKAFVFVPEGIFLE